MPAAVEEVMLAAVEEVMLAAEDMLAAVEDMAGICIVKEDIYVSFFGSSLVCTPGPPFESCERHFKNV